MGYRRGAILSIIAWALAGCQGGGANPPPFNSGNPAPTSATQSQTVSPSGGSVTTTLGTETVKVIVPSGALSGPATVTLTVYAAGSSPKTLQSSGRKVQTIGSGAALVAAFSVAISGATLLKPLQASVTTVAAPSGSIFRLAGYGTAFDDIDTATWSGGVATSDLNIAYPRMSLATAPAGTLYAFYTEPSGSASAVPTPVLTAASVTPNPIGMFGTATFTGSEMSPNGFPYLDPTFAYSLSDPTLGTINASTGAFTAGPIDGAGTVNVTDTTAGRGNPHGGGPISVTSQRPGNKGDAFNFTGTLSSTTQLVNSNPTQPQTDTASVTLNTTVTSAQVIATPAPGITTVAHSVESDAYPLQTVTTSSDTGYGYLTGTSAALPPTFVPGTVLMTETLAKDSNGSSYDTQYDVVHGNGIVDVLPEATGPFGPNTAALRYVETDPANFARNRVVAANGSYVEQGTDAFHDVQTAIVNSDLSASLDARQYSGFRFTMSAPSAPPNSRIIFRLFNAAGTQLQAFSLPNWIPATLTQPSMETDVDNGSKPYPASCSVPAKYGTSGNQIVQTINRADTAFGNLETQTTTTYMAPRVGPVCIQMTDAVQTFYDFTLQNGFVVLVSGGTLPIQLTNISETLTLQSAKTESGTTTTSIARGTSSGTRATASVPSSGFAPVSFARARFNHAVREKLGGLRKATFSHSFGNNGVKQL
ncbi:MAG: hypothetical protein QOD51_184 [Candidatus Eremiobacteraeota bacterium]|nr:hypothetical protein [Candidatus Eremiobacteraeota bacterium]